MSASPPSCRIPTSTLGVNAMRAAIVMLFEPSGAVRSRVTPARVATRFPDAPDAASVRVPTHRASALNARPNPLSPVMISPRPPLAAIAIDRRARSERRRPTPAG